MKKFLFIILLILLLPSLVYGFIVMGSNTNNSPALSIVTTNAATSIAATSATLNGTAYNYNSAGNSYFNYGLTTAYGTQTSQTAFAANTVTTTFSANVTGLTGATTYHFQACVSNGAGIACGADQSFFTTGLARISAVTTGLNNVGGSAIDSTGSFVYIGERSGPSARVQKINTSTMTVVATLTLSAANRVDGMNIDSNNLYVAAADTTANLEYLFKVSLSTFTQSAVTAGINDLGIAGSVVDTTNGFVYFMSTFSVPNNANLYKISIAGWSISCPSVSCINVDTNAQLLSAGLDIPNQIMYFGESGGVILKYNLATMANITSFTVDAALTFIRGVALDLTNGFLYSQTQIGSKIYKTSTTNFNAGGTTTLDVGATGLIGVGLMLGVGKIVYALNSSPAVLGDINSSSFTLAQTLTLNAGENSGGAYSATKALDTVNNFWYYPTFTNPVIVVKVQVG